MPGTTRNQGNRNLDLGLVNAWRVANGLGPISADPDRQQPLQPGRRARQQSHSLGDSRKLELIGQVFNLFGTDNLGGVGTAQVTNALSDSFGRILTALPRQQAELAVRFVF